MGIGTILGLRDTKPKLYAYKEALKEVARYMVSIGLLDSTVILFQLIQSGINTQTGAININWGMIWAFTLFSLAGAMVRALDKAKQIYNKEVYPVEGKSQGFIPF
jgi:hypothetical protein